MTTSEANRELQNSLSPIERLLDTVPSLLVQNVELAVCNARGRKGLISDNYYMPLVVYQLHSVLQNLKRKGGPRNREAKAFNVMVKRLEPYDLAITNDPTTNHPMMTLAGGLTTAMIKHPDIFHTLDKKGGPTMENLLFVMDQLLPSACTHVANIKKRQNDTDGVTDVIRYYDVVSGQLERALKKVK